MPKFYQDILLYSLLRVSGASAGLSDSNLLASLCSYISVLLTDTSIQFSGFAEHSMGTTPSASHFSRRHFGKLGYGT